MLDTLYKRYENIQEFFGTFLKENTVVGGLYSPNGKIPDLVVSRSKVDGHYYIFENFALARKSHVLLPISVFEAGDDVFSKQCYRPADATLS